MPFLTCVLVSHNKPTYVWDAINSVIKQGFQDWQLILFDSGVLYDQGAFSAINDPRIEVIRSWETEELRMTKTIASWCFNECIRKKLIKGRYFLTLCDDDLIADNAFQHWYNYYTANPNVLAAWGTAEMIRMDGAGNIIAHGRIVANHVKTPGNCDCMLDGGQLCNRTDLFDIFPNDECFPETRAVLSHADGVFLEKVAWLTPIYPIQEVVYVNRKVPTSLNGPTS